MDAVEKAIRSALESGDADERSFRESVYRKAFAALERAIETNPGITPDVADRRRASVQAKIAEIESEFIPALPPIDPVPRAPAEPMYRAPFEPAPRPSQPPSPAAESYPRRDDGERAWSDSRPVDPRPAEPRQTEPTPPRVEPMVPSRADPVPQRSDWALTPPAPPRTEPVPRVDPVLSRPEPALSTPPTGQRDRWVVDPVVDMPVPSGTPAPADQPEPATVPPLAAGPRVGIPVPQAPSAEPVGAPVPRVPAAPEAPSVDMDTSGPVPRSFFPDLDDFGPPGSKPAIGPEAEVATVSAAGGPNVSRERRRPFAAVFVGTTVIAAVGIGIWWGITTGLFKVPGDDGSVPNPPVTEEEDFIPEDVNNAPQMPGEADAQRNWISVFSPSDPTAVNAPGGTSAEVMRDDTGEFIRIRSGGSGSWVLFDVGQGVLEQLAGKVATFDIVARAEEGAETQFAVECNFGELGDCGRKRYAAGYAKGDFLFEVTMPTARPGAGGTIGINSDITNAGKALDVYEIRVAVSQ